MKNFVGLAVAIGALVAHAETMPTKPLVVFEQAKPSAPDSNKPGPFSRVFTLYVDGHFDYRGQVGEIEESHLQVIAILLAKARFVATPATACASPLESVARITTTRGALVWESPCRQAPDPSVDALRTAIEQLLTVELNRPPVWVERQTIAADGTITTELAVQRNGAFVRGQKRGILNDAERKQLATALESARFLGNTECKQQHAKAERRLWAWPRTVEYANACAGKLDAGTVKLEAELERLTNKEPKLLLALEAQNAADAPWVPRAALYSDGSYVVDELTDKLTADELAKWQSKINGAKLALVATTGGTGCTRASPIAYRLRTARGELRHRACQNTPHPSVAQLETELQALRERDPRKARVAYLQTAPDGAPPREDIVFLDGTMLVDEAPRSIDASNASALQGHLLATRFAVARRGDDGCKARQTRFLLEAPGFGHLQWSEPCETPDATVRALVDRLGVLRATKPTK